MPATPSDRLGLARPADGDFINTWPATARAALDALDDRAAVFDTTDPRPAASVPGRFHRHPTTGVISYDTGSAWVQIATAPIVKTFQTTLNYAIGGLISVASGDTDYIPPVRVAVAAGQTVKLIKTIGRINSGTQVIYKIQRNEVDVATGLGADPGADHVDDIVDVVLADGDRLQPRVTSAVGSPKNLSITFVLEHTI